MGDLRYFLNAMNQSLNSAPDDYAIIFASPMTIQLNGNLPIINNSSNAVNITIGNPGTIPTVTIDGNGAYSGFFIPMGNVTIQNMIFQNLIAKGGDGGDGISGGGGGLGAGAAIFAPQTFLNGSHPAITLMNISISNCSAIGGNGAITQRLRTLGMKVAVAAVVLAGTAVQLPPVAARVVLEVAVLVAMGVRSRFPPLTFLGAAAVVEVA